MQKLLRIKEINKEGNWVLNIELKMCGFDNLKQVYGIWLLIFSKRFIKSLLFF